METKYKVINEDTTNDIIYLDIFFFNKTNQNQPLIINVSRTESITPRDINDYLFSIIRFKLPVIQPIFIFPIQYPMYVKIEYNNISHELPVQFQQEPMVQELNLVASPQF